MKKAHLITEEADTLMAQLEEERQLLAQVSTFYFPTFVTRMHGQWDCVLYYHDQ